MNGGEQRDGINMTRALEALAPYLENPRQTVLRNEVFVAAAAALLFLQLILAPWRRWSAHWFVQGTLWVTYTMSFPLITYTLGQMVTSPVKNGLYPVWTMILFWATGCANAFMAYSIEDNKQWKRYLFEFFQYCVYVGLILSLLRRSHSDWRIIQQPIVFPLALLLCTVIYNNLCRIHACWMVTNSVPSKLVADYIRAQVDARATQSFNPITMNGYRYLVRPDDAVTINTVWEMISDDSLLGTTGGGSELKDVCLSFALSLLLRRHYFELDCAEVGLLETFRFALEGLMPENDEVNHYSRGFHIIEVELGFLYDFFFTKYATLFQDEKFFLIMTLLKLVFTSISGAVVLVHSPILRTADPIIDVGTRRVDVTVTFVIMGVLLLFETLQVILYLMSDWATVSLACSYVRGDIRKLFPSIIRTFRRFKFGNLCCNIMLSGYWQNKVGQSSIIEGSLGVDLPYVNPIGSTMASSAPFKALGNLRLDLSWLICSMKSSRKKFVPIPNLIKDEIVSCLRTYSNGGPLTNGKAALDRNGVLEEFSCTLENHSQTTAMLIWHIATQYCSIASSNGSDAHESGAKQVATTLSKYCAYLMVFVPELLPGNSTDTLFVVHDVLSEVKSALGGSEPTRHILLRAIHDSGSSRNNGSSQDHSVIHESNGSDNIASTIHTSVSSNEDKIIPDSGGSNNDRTSAPFILEGNIFIKGLKLGRELDQKDVALRWKLLAEFWAETIIYIAPSDKAVVHMERLAQGGEFLTHIWALLKHAGITKRDHKKTPDDLV